MFLTSAEVHLSRDFGKSAQMEENRSDTEPGWPREDQHDVDLGPTTGQHEELPAPVDLRDTHGNAGESIGTARATSALDVEMPDGGPYPLPDERLRPFRALDPADVEQVTVDPSLSRPVDRAAAGMAPEARGYDRTNDGPPPGPLGPDAALEDADAGDEPAGQYGSSG